MHLFQPNKQIPYMVMYLPEESKLLQKMTKSIKKKGIHRKNNWNMEMPNIIQFRILMPKEIKNVDGDPIVNDIYMQVQLYNYKEIWVTLNIKREERIYIHLVVSNLMLFLFIFVFKILKNKVFFRQTVASVFF